MNRATLPKAPPLPGFIVEAPPRTNVREFSDVRLKAERMRRIIAILSKEGDRPCVAITIFDGGKPTSRFLFHAGDELTPLLEAIRVVRDPGFREGLKACGSFPMSHGARVTVSAQAPIGKLPAVLIVHSRDDGKQLGNGTSIFGAELDALDAACSALLELQRRNT